MRLGEDSNAKVGIARTSTKEITHINIGKFSNKESNTKGENLLDIIRINR